MKDYISRTEDRRHLALTNPFLVLRDAATFIFFTLKDDINTSYKMDRVLISVRIYKTDFFLTEKYMCLQIVYSSYCSTCRISTIKTRCVFHIYACAFV